MYIPLCVSVCMHNIIPTCIAVTCYVVPSTVQIIIGIVENKLYWCSGSKEALHIKNLILNDL